MYCMLVASIGPLLFFKLNLRESIHIRKEVNCMNTAAQVIEFWIQVGLLSPSIRMTYHA